MPRFDAKHAAEITARQWRLRIVADNAAQRLDRWLGDDKVFKVATCFARYGHLLSSTFTHTIPIAALTTNTRLDDQVRPRLGRSRWHE